MSNDRVATLVMQLDHAREHAWESLTGVLEGVTEAEASWQASCFQTDDADKTGEGEPVAGSIHWQVWHLAACKAWYAERLLTPPEQKVPGVDVPGVSYPEDLDRLAKIHVRQREAIASLDDAQLDLTYPTGESVIEFISSTIRHDAWHAGQIALVRRLYRTRDV